MLNYCWWHMLASSSPIWNTVYTYTSWVNLLIPSSLNMGILSYDSHCFVSCIFLNLGYFRTHKTLLLSMMSIHLMNITQVSHVGIAISRPLNRFLSYCSTIKLILLIAHILAIYLRWADLRCYIFDWVFFRLPQIFVSTLN